MILWSDADDGVLLAFSGRAASPAGGIPRTADAARRFAEELGCGQLPLAHARQVHGAQVAEAREDPPPGEVRDLGPADVVLTGRRGIGVLVQTADCVPILLAAQGAVAAVHAGWRGTVREAARAGVRALSARAGADPARIRAVIGPAIGACCYEVGGEVAANFAGEFLRRECSGKFRLDLKGANRAQLEAEGVPGGRITTLPFCTLCGGETLASYRRDGASAGRMIALAALL